MSEECGPPRTLSLDGRRAIAARQLLIEVMDRAVDDRIRATTGVGRGVFESTSFATDDPSQQINCPLNLVRDSVVALDRQARVTFLNHAAEQLYGWTSLETVGRAATTTLFAHCKVAFDALWREVLATGEWHGEIAQRTKRGTERVTESRWSVVRNNHSSDITSVWIVSNQSSDVTHVSLAHEIRNPLAGIKGVADAFLQRGQLTRQEREWMEAVRYEVMKIDARLRELLDVSQPRVFNIRLCSLSELISRVVLLATHQLQSHADRKGRRIAIDFIDATAEPVLLSLDSARVEDAVLNLVLNAIESIEGDGRVTVCLRRRSARRSCASGDGEAVIEVADTGCGIPLEIRSRIFEPLFTTKRGGTGLGLAAVRRTAAACHGRISFKTRIGRGSTFVLALPIGSQPNLTENPK